MPLRAHMISSHAHSTGLCHPSGIIFTGHTGLFSHSHMPACTRRSRAPACAACKATRRRRHPENGKTRANINLRGIGVKSKKGFLPFETEDRIRKNQPSKGRASLKGFEFWVLGEEDEGIGYRGEGGRGDREPQRTQRASRGYFDSDCSPLLSSSSSLP